MNKGVNLKTIELLKIVLFGLVVVGCSRPPEPVKLDGGSAKAWLSKHNKALAKIHF